MITIEKVRWKIRNFDPLIYADQNWNIWLFESFGIGIEVSDSSICLILGFLTINCYLISNFIADRRLKKLDKQNLSSKIWTNN